MPNIRRLFEQLERAQRNLERSDARLAALEEKREQAINRATQRAVLKAMGTTLRPVSALAVATTFKPKVVRACLRRMEAQGLVLERKKDHFIKRNPRTFNPVSVKARNLQGEEATDLNRQAFEILQWLDAAPISSLRVAEQFGLTIGRTEAALAFLEEILTVQRCRSVTRKCARIPGWHEALYREIATMMDVDVSRTDLLERTGLLPANLKQALTTLLRFEWIEESSVGSFRSTSKMDRNWRGAVIPTRSSTELEPAVAAE